MKKVAVVGSRAYPRIELVSFEINRRFEQDGLSFIVVSGGAAGVDTAAEQTWLEFGGPVSSFRPVRIESRPEREAEYGVEEWRLHRGTGQIVHHNEPSWADWPSAAFYRNLLMAERCDEAVVFWDGTSHGTAHMIDALKACEKPYEVISPV